MVLPCVDLDRSNLGNARLQGLPKDTLKHGDPTGKLFDWVNSVFFFAYVFSSAASVVPLLFLHFLFSQNRFFVKFQPRSRQSSSSPVCGYAALQ
jgi:hypothetical protein